MVLNTIAHNVYSVEFNKNHMKGLNHMSITFKLGPIYKELSQNKHVNMGLLQAGLVVIMFIQQVLMQSKNFCARLN